MIRSHLVEILEAMSPALAKNETVAKLAHFWFTGDRVIADNTVIRMEAPLKTPFTGGIPGSRMLNLLRASRFKELKFISKHEDELIIKSAGTSTKMSFAMLPVAELGTRVKGRAMNKDKQFAVNRKKLHRAIQNVLLSVAKDDSKVGARDVTLIGRGSTIDMYSTNDAQLSHSRLKLTHGTFKGRVLIPVDFLRQAIAVSNEKDQSIWLEIQDDDKASFVQMIGVHDIQLSGSLPSTKDSHLINFDKIMDKLLPEKARAQLGPIPTKLELVLERATIIEGDSSDEILTVIEVDGTKATFATDSKKGDAWDEVEITKGVKARIEVSPKRVREGIGPFASMLITDACFIMEAKDIEYLVIGAGK